MGSSRSGVHMLSDALARLEVEALTFDDVLLTPGYTEPLPNEVDISIALHPRLHLNILVLMRLWTLRRTVAMLQRVTAGSPTLAALAQRLVDILDAMQASLNLFTLWRNMRISRRGKRQSLYQRRYSIPYR
jgi:hypothetical protein